MAILKTRVHVIKVFDIEIEAFSYEAAAERISNLQREEIEANGKLVDCTISTSYELPNE